MVTTCIAHTRSRQFHPTQPSKTRLGGVHSFLAQIHIFMHILNLENANFLVDGIWLEKLYSHGYYMCLHTLGEKMPLFEETPVTID